MAFYTVCIILNLLPPVSLLKILEAGMISISAEEKAAFPEDTAEDNLIPGRYVVELNVFHQLHCLVWLDNTLSIFANINECEYSICSETNSTILYTLI
jgi:hypothetical protein